jgi:predicted transcriptional regulator
VKRCPKCEGSGDCIKCDGHGEIPDAADIRALRPPGVTQADMAAALECSTGYIGHLESGIKDISRNNYDILRLMLEQLEKDIGEDE